MSRYTDPDEPIRLLITMLTLALAAVLLALWDYYVGVRG